MFWGDQGKALEVEQAKNRAVEAQVLLVEREVAKLRDTHAKELARLSNVSDEVDVLKSTLAKASEELAQSTTSNEQAGYSSSPMNPDFQDGHVCPCTPTPSKHAFFFHDRSQYTIQIQTHPKRSSTILD